MAVIRLPLKHYGQQIGEVVVDETGVVTFVAFETSQEFGEQLYHHAIIGDVTGVSLSPIMPPTVPSKILNGGNNFGPRKPIFP